MLQGLDDFGDGGIGSLRALDFCLGSDGNGFHWRIMNLIICSPKADSMVMTTRPWAVMMAPSATSILLQMGDWSDCLSKACLTRPEDNTKH
uniref:Uncharacterized protein n=1 Tax=Romanomermis culicivorax TaxID=13658 RepID=A0A915JZI3_ROMCU